MLSIKIKDYRLQALNAFDMVGQHSIRLEVFTDILAYLDLVGNGRKPLLE